MECGVGVEKRFHARCLFYEFITRETLIKCNQGDNESDVLVKLFRVLGYPGVWL